LEHIYRSNVALSSQEKRLQRGIYLQEKFLSSISHNAEPMVDPGHNLAELPSLNHHGSPWNGVLFENVAPTKMNDFFNLFALHFDFSVYEY